MGQQPVAYMKLMFRALIEGLPGMLLLLFFILLAFGLDSR